jgi:signal peptidase I
MSVLFLASPSSALPGAFSRLGEKGFKHTGPSMNFDFLFILAALTLISGLIYLLDVLSWAKKRTANAKPPLGVEYARSFFPIFLAVLIIRSFIGQIFHVPTGSLEPTVMPGDFMAVTQYNYGLRVPVINKKILPTSEPKRGDIVVFTWPVNPKVNFVKRVIGLPGDTISFMQGIFSINGKVMPQTFVEYAMDNNGANTSTWPVKIMIEDLGGVKHKIYVCADLSQCPSATSDFYNLVVPANHYFMVGDNRNNSGDSRIWGFVPEENLIGKGQIIIFNWGDNFTWRRIGKLL